LEAKFTSHNSECTVTQSEIASPKLTSWASYIHKRCTK
jgi:hypothetical protein